MYNFSVLYKEVHEEAKLLATIVLIYSSVALISLKVHLLIRLLPSVLPLI